MSKYTETCRRALISRRVQRMKMRSDVKEIRRSLASCREETQIELSRRKQLLEDLQAVKQSRAASNALRFWQPVEIRRQYESVATQEPVLAKWREAGLMEELKNIEQRLRTLRKRLKLKSEDLKRKRQKLKDQEG